MSEGARARRRPSNASDRRPLRFWEPFNIWWRAELEKTGKRATSDDIARWYAAQSCHAWGEEKPSLQETRTHAKCLRSVSSVRDYFREYRAKKKHEQSEMEMDEEEEEDRRRSKGSRRGSGARSTAANSNSTAAYSDISGAMQSYMAYSNEQGYWGSGYLEGAASGMTTAAGAAAAGVESHAAALQAMAEYGQHMPGFDMTCVHPGAYEAAWADYQQAAAAAALSNPVTTQGPTLPSTQAMQQASQNPEQQQEQSGAGGAAGAANGGPPPSWQQQGGAEPQGSGQQQSQQQEQLGVHPLQLPAAGTQARAGRMSMNLLSPGLQQLANSLAFQMEMPSISPRMPRGPAMAGVNADMGTSGAAGGSYMPQEGLAVQAAAVKVEQGQQQASTIPLWDLAEQHYGAHANQSYLSAAAGFGGFAAQLNAMQQAHQQSALGHQPVPSWFPQQLRQQGPTAADGEGCTDASAVHAGSPAEFRGASTQPAADAPAAAPQAARKPLQQDPPAAAAAPAEAPSVCDTPHGVIPASLLAAVPLPPAMPGCPGHSTVDSILRQLEAGGRTPRGLMGPLAALGSDGHPFSRMSVSNMLDAQGLMCHGATATRQLSQSFEHMPLPPHQRLSLYAMGSGMLDMLSEGLDLDAFLGASDLAGAAAGGGGGDTIAPIAPGSRASLRWLRASCQMQVPEHWQQHLQTLQEAPFRGGMGPGAAPPQAPFRMGRASSAGIDALAEAAAAVLAAHPELMQERGAAGTSAQQAEGAEAQQGAAAGSDAGRPAPCRKRTREQQATKAEMGPPGSSYKRPCAGAALGLNLGGDQQDAEGGKSQGFRYILDLATPRPQPAQQQPKPQPQPEQPGQGQQEVQHNEQAGADAAAPAAEAAAPDVQQDASALQKRPVVLDLRPEELGATSENSLATPQRGAARAGAKPSVQQPQQAEAETAAGPEQEAADAAAQVQQGSRKLEGLMLAPLRSPVGGYAGMSTKGGLHCGPATAASTTGAPPVGPNGAILPAPAMAHVAMAAAAAVRPHVQAGVAPAAPRRPSDPAKRLLPAMDEIERMI